MSSSRVEYPELRKIQKELLGIVYSPKFTGAKKGSLLSPIKIERLELYRDVTFYLLREAIEWIYPITHQTFEGQQGSKDWQRFIDRYLTRFPPVHYALIPSVARLPSMFKSGSWQREVAEFELTRTEIRNGIAPEDSGVCPPWMNPALRLMSSRHAISDWFKELEKPGLIAPVSKKPPRSTLGIEFVAVFLCPVSDQVRTLALHPIAFTILTLCQSGLSVEQAIRKVTKKINAPLVLKSEIESQIYKLFLNLTEEKALFANPLSQ
ncbi:MAG: hypothetical protein AABZ55_03990 [Bdellovibrionota bacterium]